MKGRYPIYNYKTENVLEPIRKVEKITLDDTLELTNYNVCRDMAFKIAEAYDEEIFSQIVEIARLEGYTDVTILDKEFIISAIKHEKERRENL